MTPALVEQPHERRVQRFAYAALILAVGLGAVQAFRSPGMLLGFQVPLLASISLLVVGAGLGVAGAARRASGLAFTACALVVLAVVPAGVRDPGLPGYALAFAFGAAVLAFGELVHMTHRYEKAHRAVEEEGVPEESLDRVTDEAVKTLGFRLGAATLLVFAGALVALGLARAGPLVWRESIETASPLGVALVGLAALAAVSAYVLFQGARERPAEADSISSLEVVADVPE